MAGGSGIPQPSKEAKMLRRKKKLNFRVSAVNDLPSAYRHRFALQEPFLYKQATECHSTAKRLPIDGEQFAVILTAGKVNARYRHAKPHRADTASLDALVALCAFSVCRCDFLTQFLFVPSRTLGLPSKPPSSHTELL